MKRALLVAAVAAAALSATAAKADSGPDSVTPELIPGVSSITIVYPDGHLLNCRVAQATLFGQFRAFQQPTLTGALVHLSDSVCRFTFTPEPPQHCGGPNEPTCPPIVPGVTPMCTDDGVTMIPCKPGMY